MYKPNPTSSYFKSCKRKILIKKVFFICLTVLVTENNFAQVFTKVTDGAIVNEQNNSYYAAWGDYDKDGDLDLFHSLFAPAPNNPNGDNFLFQNNCNGGFSKISNIPVGIVKDGLTGAHTCWIDYDNDNDLDLYVGENNLYENNGDGSFTSVNKVITNLPSDIRGVGVPTFADYDNDGFLDVYTGKQSIYKNNKSGDFIKLDVAPFSTARIAQVAAVGWADYDNDGFMDMYVVNTLSFNPDLSFAGFGTNYLYHNNGNGTFSEDLSNPSMIQPTWGYGCAWADVDNDLDLDLMVEDILSASGRRLYINNGNGIFTKVLTGDIATVNASGQGGFSFADYDNDGDLDLFSPTFSQNKLFDNNGDGTFTNNVTEIISNDVVQESFGGAWADYDNDGDLDLFVPTGGGNNSDLLYKNNTSGRHWFKLHLSGTNSNKDAIGARIYVKAIINGVSKWQMREVNANTTRGGESGGSSGHVVHFGLGDATIIDSLKIVWPASGIKQYFVNVTPNRFVEISESINTVTDIASCRPDLPIANPGYVSGKMYTDINNNCEFNEGIDFPIANKIVRAEPGSYFVFTDDSGNYTLDLPAGNYTVRQNPQSDGFYFNTCQTDTIYTVAVTIGDTLKNKNYAYQQKVTAPCPTGAFNVTIQGIGIVQGACPTGQVLMTPCPNFRYQYCFNIINNTTAPSTAGAILSVTLPPGFQIQTITSPCIIPVVAGNNTNTQNIPINGIMPIGGSCNVCIVVLAGPTVVAPFTIIANFNNTPPGPNLVINGNFSAGNTGFTSAYIPDCVSATGHYCVGSTPTVMNGWWVQAPRSAPNFLYADAGVGNVWSETLPVTINTTYNFTAWFNNLINPTGNFDDPRLQVFINGGVAESTVGPITEVPNAWIPSNFLWCSNASTSANITISFLPPNGTGNDFGIDDISFNRSNSNTATIIQTNSCSCDPNDKTVNPVGCGPNGNIGKNQSLTYTVRFENTGSGPAHNILLSDKLDSDLDLSTLQILASSHTITDKLIMSDNNLIIKFDGIELPDNVSNPDGAKGFVVFSISPKKGLADGTQIKNQTGIYFDDNSVVLTDVTLNTLYDKPLPDAKFSYNHACSQAGLVYDFNYTGTTHDNATYSWTFEDGTPNTATDKNPTNIIFSNNTGYKLVTLTVNKNGCIDFVTDTIKVITGLSDNGNKVTVCHNGQAITVNQNALAAHLSHGDCVGECAISSNARKASVGAPEYVNQLFTMMLLPNPSNEDCKIQLQGLQKDGDKIVVEVYNYAGQLVKTINSQEHEINIDTKELSSGIYLVKVTCNESVLVDKLIIEH